jgi:lactoylglutathione lyase
MCNPGAVADIGVEQVVPLLLVKSMQASLLYYVDGLGFTMTNQWIDQGELRWCWLQLGGAALMLQQSRDDHHEMTRADGPVGVGVGFNFICRDALAFYHQVTARGITTKRPFVGNRMWVTSLRDPDGYEHHFESPTDAPEETEYDG